MSASATASVVAAAGCGCAAALACFVRRRRQAIGELTAARRAVFEERVSERLAHADGAPPYAEAEDLLRRAVEYGACPQVRQRLADACVGEVARAVATVAAGAGDDDEETRSILSRLEEVLLRTDRLAALLGASTAEAAVGGVVSADTTARFDGWVAAQRARGWRALGGLVWRYHGGQLYAAAASVALGVVRPRKLAADAALLSWGVGGAAAGAEDALPTLVASACGLEVASSVVAYFSSAYAQRLSAATTAEVRRACVDRVARSDLDFLASVNVAQLIEVLGYDQRQLERVLAQAQVLVQAVAQGVAVGAMLLRVPCRQAVACAAVAAAYRVVLRGLRRAEMLLLVTCEDEDLSGGGGGGGDGDGELLVLGGGGGGRTLWDLFASMDAFMAHRFLGQETRIAARCVEEDARETAISASNTALGSTLLQRGGSADVCVRLLCQTACRVVVGDAGGADAFTCLDELFAVAARAVSAVQQLRGLWLPCLRIHTLLRLQPRIDPGDDVGLKTLGGAAHDLVFNDVTFRGTGGSGAGVGGAAAVLDNVSFTVPAGAHVGVVGPSGCGKSTLLTLVSRLYDPASGEVLLAGRPLKEYNAGWLRREVVSGTTSFMGVYSDSLCDNVRLSRPDATVAEVEAALKEACADEFVRERGLFARMDWSAPRLSTGQEARLFLARALLARPRILVLDEVSAHLDAVTEEALRGRLAEVSRQGTTVLNVSHRLSFLKGCDAIVVLDEAGRVTHNGTHTELLEGCPWYADACAKQSTA
eukprot:Rhum_TRINITY_DN14312_c1_g2::Rhum_TRINITY_DN14312_c1_g2_i1::g.79276::m.79276/K06147/ABCB-BAC; ATP-binding cassette, subfamily B, bacterial